MLAIHLIQPGFTYSVCGPFAKNKERIKKFKETWGPRYIYQNELDEARFQHDMTFWIFLIKSLLHTDTFAGSGVKIETVSNQGLTKE